MRAFALCFLAVACSSNNTTTLTCPSQEPNKCGTGSSAYCTSFTTDQSNCGACGKACAASERCTATGCVGCPSGLSSCSTVGGGVFCADLTSDTSHCGACGTVCGGGQTCNSGHCGCPSATPDACNGFCTDLTRDPNNCGACGTTCPAGELCTATGCKAQCPGASTACPASGTPSYCANLQTDPANCGACGNACPLLGETCVSGACTCSYTQVAMGLHMSCALKSDGTVSCWGTGNAANQSDYGISGSSGVFGSNLPQKVPGLTGVVKLVGGANLICALKGDGTIACWGGNGQGQLGINEPDGGPAQALPMQVQLLGSYLPDGGTGLADGGDGDPGALTSATDLSAHNVHACAVSGGDVYCWGSNTKGQLGDGTTTERDGAVRALTPGGVTFTKVAVGWQNTCALSTAGEVWCWGNDSDGESGGGGTGPTQVAGLEGAVALSLGGGHTTRHGWSCAVVSDGGVSCWGSDNSSYLGDNGGSTTPSPVSVLYSADGGTTDLVPLGGIASISAGERGTCARSTDGHLYCWGQSDYGELGLSGLPDGGGGFVSPPVAEQIPGFDGVISQGIAHRSSCAVRSDNTLWCWGLNRRGQLANGATPSYGIALPVPSPSCQ